MFRVLALGAPLLFTCLASAQKVDSHSGAPPAFMGQLTLLLLVGALAAFLSFRVGLVPIIGFLLAGVLAGPSLLGIIDDPAVISSASDIGVMLLLFAIGIEFSLDKLARIARLIFLGGGAQVVLTVVITTLLLSAFGVSFQNSVFTGFLLSLSSTAIVMKILEGRGGTSTETGQVSLGILIFQDLAVVVMVLLVPMLAGQGGGALGIVVALGKAAGIVAAVLLLARRVVPKVLEVVARTCSQEIFLLTIVAACFGTAYLTSLAGVSLALGAFLAGLLVSESRFGRQALGEILPLQILFSAAFFLSVGLQLDVRFLLSHLPLVLAGVVLIALLKALLTTVSVRILGQTLATATATGWLLAQIGEFSFVLESSGRALGLTPAGLGSTGTQTFIAATVLLMALTPVMADIGERLGLRKRSAGQVAALTVGLPPQVDAQTPLAHLQNHIIVAGFGPHARRIARELKRQAVPFGVLTLSPDGAADVAEHNVPVVIGDYARSALLSEAAIQRARALVVVDDTPEMAARVTSVARTLNPSLTIIAHTDDADEIATLTAVGATSVVTSQDSVARGVLARLGLTMAPAHHDPSGLITLTAAQQEMCDHAHGISSVVPDARDVCPECVALGDTWVHLRVCMTCGHVGCCDSSKNRHATAHAQASTHPLIRSLEPNEDWAYCYPHDLTR
ncbi:cation:proton antiporter (plasmid) [Deinococcus sp. KNUC1210]|uniref:cation:proton antiporter n=1 Tax=Deinococcus sp. KNUC1210 TaxID=2917691 RepID=UPI001EF13548|nr:cation:proton antiporter [Deinococcus sp. KNUC1210]ULH16976.1 cation:proton antiporter [Deinococcus sp. KNUC1210]